MKVQTIYGTRPEAIKIAPLAKELDKSSVLESVIVSTGQHREMLAQVNSRFGLSPDYELSLMEQAQSLNSLVVKVIASIDEVLCKEKPDGVIVQGDTTTAMAGAIAAFNRQIPIFHLEAGLRTRDLTSPFPEEANRKIIGSICQLHLCPTHKSKTNLLEEGVAEENIMVTGNTVIDALQLAAKWEVKFTDKRVRNAIERQSDIILVTTHRRENMGAMKQIGNALAEIAKKYPKVIIIFPAHLNPRVREAVLPEIEGLPNILVCPPLSYAEFIGLMVKSKIVLTDSGGVQEEAPGLGKPVLVMRNTTERPEAVEAGTVKLVGTASPGIQAAVDLLLNDPEEYAKMAKSANPYGDGKAAPRAVSAICQYFGLSDRIEEFDEPTLRKN